MSHEGNPTADEKPHHYSFPMVSVATDIACFTVNPKDGLQVALVRRSWKSKAFPGYWALPGGFFHPDKDQNVMDCARRELFEETRLEAAHLELVGVYSDKGRDSRPERIISLAFLAVIPAHDLALAPVPDTDVTAARWFSYDRVMQMDLAFDHCEIIKAAREKLAGQIAFGARDNAEPELLFTFLPAQFSIARAKQVTADIKGICPDPANFRKWIERYLTRTEEGFEYTRTRKAHLYERKHMRSGRIDRTGSVPTALGGVHALAEHHKVEDIDLLVGGMREAPAAGVAFLEHILAAYADHAAYTLKITRVPDLRINDRRTRRVLLTLVWQVRNKGFACTCLAEPERLQSADLDDLRSWSNGPHQSTFRLDGRASDDARLARALREAVSVLRP